jgi:hydroxypyruvate reductase
MTAERDPETLHVLREDAGAIFTHALDACRIERVFEERIRFEGTTLIIEHPPWMERSIQPTHIDLRLYRRVLIVALGKAAVPMTQSLLAVLPRGPRVLGVCSAPSKPAARDWRIYWYAGGHPLPNQDSFRAARRALRMLRRALEKTLVIYLISGGGSTVFDLPLDPKISLADTIAFHQALIASGATIAEINTLRKHFSSVKGGRLAQAARRAAQLTLQIVDVPAHHRDAVASGPTIEDPSTVEDCREILERYHLLEQFPAAVRQFFSRADLPETPGDKAALKRLAEKREEARKAGIKRFSFAYLRPNAPNTGQLATLLSNRDLLRAAHEKAAALGYEVVIDNACDDWPYDKAADYLADRLTKLRAQHPGRKLCLLSGGEVTVHIDRAPGMGGRNQQFALACALLLEERLRGQAIVCLSAGSDGADGNSPAAGAFVDPATGSRARAHNLDPTAALANFDAGTLFSALGDGIVTGPTGNNLRDLRIFLSA